MTLFKHQAHKEHQVIFDFILVHLVFNFLVILVSVVFQFPVPLVVLAASHSASSSPALVLRTSRP